MTLPQPQKSFLDYVQQHERAWGDKDYKGRPSLAKILEATIVVFWKTEKDGRYKITLHEEISQVEKLLVRILISADAAPERIGTIFKNQKKLAITGVSIHFREV